MRARKRRRRRPLRIGLALAGKPVCAFHDKPMTTWPSPRCCSDALHVVLSLLFLLGVARAVADQIDEGAVLPVSRSISIQINGQGQFRGLVFPPPSSSDGEETGEVVGFLGIRYASSPSKRLRFMPPTAFRYQANQLHDMQQFGPICWQRTPADYLLQISNRTIEGRVDEPAMRLVGELMSRASFAYLKPTLARLSRRTQSEDCLNLNVFAPIEVVPAQESGARKASESKLRPVLVIVHGESFDFGAGATINALRFARQTRLLAITFNYRLNILGFPPKLAGASRGNLGLMDQIAALHWIKDNIESFGGSPGNITLMGSKRAAAIVHLLMLSPLARGLFQRAIMEDGSALSPLVANHVGAPATFGATSFVPPAVQHFRLLARLCDCPVYGQKQLRNPFMPASSNATLPSNQAAQSPATSSASTASAPPLAPRQYQASQRQQMANFADETKTNALTFECLRHKPMELIMQRIPLHLLHLDTSGGHIFMPSKASSDFLASEFSSSDNNNSSSQISFALLNRLIVSAHELELKRLSADATQPDVATSLIDKLEPAELFGAIYTPPVDSMRPLFHPVIDGTVVPDEDFASLVLSSKSFAQRDLLLGLSQKSPLEVGELSAKGVNVANPIWDKVSAKLEQLGLTNEQAIELVNVFVRSFYRHHQQEISNSIVNHYLSSIGSRYDEMIRTREQRQPVPDSNEENLNRNVSVERQKFVLDALTTSFQDALTNVPIIKTALIHTIRQLESLVDAFVGQQFDKWRRGIGRAEVTGSSNDTALKTLEAFSNFAKALMSDPNWPLELHQPEQQQEIQQPRGTYLFELDPGALLKIIKRLVDRPMFHGASLGGWRLLHDILTSLHTRMISNPIEFPVLNRLSIACGLDFEDVGDIARDNVHQLADRLFNWLCAHFNNLIGSFVASGRMDNSAYLRSDTLRVSELSEKIAAFEETCLGRVRADTNLVYDHQLVQANMASNGSQNSESCQTKLHEMALDCITNEFTNGLQTGDYVGNSWPVFNIFTQQVATLPGRQSLWQTDALMSAHNSKKSDTTESAGLARVSFWSNFIPALDCAKTQPVVPSSMLADQSEPLAHPLLDVNLQFSCQQGAQTSIKLFETLVKTINQQLEEMKTHWLAHRGDINENHHSLRMANMSQSGQESGNDAADEDASNKMTNRQMVSDDSQSQTSNMSNDESDHFLKRLIAGARKRYTFSILLLGGLIVSLTIALVAYVVMRQRKNRRVKKSKAGNGSIQAEIIDNHRGASDGNEMQNLHNSSSSEAPSVELMRPTLSLRLMSGAEAPQFPNSLNLHQSDLGQRGHNTDQIPSSDQQTGIENRARDTCHVGETKLIQGEQVAVGQSWINATNDDSYMLCQSHSSMNTVVTPTTDGTITASGHHLIPANSPQNGNCAELVNNYIVEQPIIMPIVGSLHRSKPHGRQSSSRTGSLLRSNGSQAAPTGLSMHQHTGRRTQHSYLIDNFSGSSDLTASKKRVKINDLPMSLTPTMGNEAKVKSSSRSSLTNAGESAAICCPVHSTVQSQSLHLQNHRQQHECVHYNATIDGRRVNLGMLANHVGFVSSNNIYAQQQGDYNLYGGQASLMPSSDDITIYGPNLYAGQQFQFRENGHSNDDAYHMSSQ